MSGFAYNLKYTTAMTPMSVAYDDEGAGKVGKILGAVVAIAIPFAAPMVWGALAGSTAIGASISGALTGAFGASVGGIIGSAGVGALMGAASAYAQGARGGAVWASALSGGLGGGIGQFTRGLNIGGANAGATAGAGAGAGAGTNAVGGTGPVSLAPTAGVGPTNLATGATVNAPASGIMGQIGNIFNSGLPIDRIGTALVNAIVNNGSQEQLDALVAQQQAALAGLNAQEQAAYAQRMGAAQQVLAAANRMDPQWLARVRMADVAGVMNREHDEALRRIAVRQGGGLDAGQRKAYERSGRLDIGRAKALAWGKGQADGTTAQAQLFGQAAGLFTGPNFQPWEAETNLRLGHYRATQQIDRSNAAGFASIFNERDYAQPTSPETNTGQNNNENDDPFTSGTTSPFVWAGG